MIGCLQTRVRKQPIIALYFESETVVKFYNLGARSSDKTCFMRTQTCTHLLTKPDKSFFENIEDQDKVTSYIWCLSIVIHTSTIYMTLASTGILKIRIPDAVKYDNMKLDSLYEKI